MSLRGTFLVVLIIAIAALAVPLLFSQGRSGSSTDRNGAHIGVYHDTYAGMRAALLMISEDIRRYPRAQEFYVSWSNTNLAWVHLADKDYERFSFIYDRKTRRLTYNSAGAGGGWDGVTVEMIAKAYENKDPFDAFGKLGCKSWP